MPMPWEIDWVAKEQESRKTPAPAEPSKKPWEIDWVDKIFGSKKASPSPQKQPTANDQMLGNGLTLDTVFEGLKRAESGGIHIDPKTGGLLKSKAGAEGITQLMPKTAANPGYGITPVKDKSEEEYLRVGKSLLDAMYKKYGDWELALAAYNAGVGNVEKAKGKAERYGGGWKDYLPKPQETLPYIDKILGKGKLQSSLDRMSPSLIEGTSGKQMVENAKGAAYNIVSMTPIIGDALSLKDAVEGFFEGDKVKMALGAAGALPMVPGMIRPKPYFHGTRKDFEKHGEGLIFLTDNPYKAGEYASGGGGQRGRTKAAFYTDQESGAIYEQHGDELIQVVGKEKGKKLPADVEELQDMGIYPTESWDKTNVGENIRRYYVDTNKTLDLHHKGYDRAGKPINEGATVLATIDPKGNRWATEVVNKAKRGEFDWSTTKYPEAQKAWKEIIIPQLQKKGYDSIQYWDDMHPTLAVFDEKQLMSTLPKKLKTQDIQRQKESINNMADFLEKHGKTEEAAKLRSLNAKER